MFPPLHSLLAAAAVAVSFFDGTRLFGGETGEAGAVLTVGGMGDQLGGFSLLFCSFRSGEFGGSEVDSVSQSEVNEIESRRKTIF